MLNRVHYRISVARTRVLNCPKCRRHTHQPKLIPKLLRMTTNGDGLGCCRPSKRNGINHAPCALQQAIQTVHCLYSICYVVKRASSAQRHGARRRKKGEIFLEIHINGKGDGPRTSKERKETRKGGQHNWLQCSRFIQICEKRAGDSIKTKLWCLLYSYCRAVACFVFPCARNFHYLYRFIAATTLRAP